MPLEALQNGRYRRLHQLGGGGMGEVYLMEDTRINRQVAIKIIRAEAGPYPDSDAARDAARLFQREARTIATLDHPNILPLYDFGEESLGGATLTYMVMPYCAEGSFADWLRQHSRTTSLSPQDFASFITQAADALQYAHNRQVLHLDVKPSNFLVRSNTKDPTRPILLLADFGVARMSAATTGSSRTVRGTPTSMAPEQWSSAPVPVTDQYALAVMAYELLVGRPPFHGGLEQLMFQHFQAQPPAPGSFNPRLAGAVDTVLLRALAKRPAERFPTISAFAEALEQAVKALPPQVAIRVPQPSPSDIRAILAISTTEAVAGTNRTLTLPSGRKIIIFVPPGAYDGQVIRVPNPGDPGSAGSSPGVLILTLAVQPAEPAMLAPDAEGAQQTLHQPAPTVQASDPNLPPIIAPPPPPPGPAFPLVSRQTARPAHANMRTMLLIGLVLLVIAGSVGFFSVIHANQVATTNANATATTVASKATGMTTAQVYATATASFIAANLNPYGVGGTLALNDPLRDNNNGYNWSTGATSPASDCQFSGGAYYASQQTRDRLACDETADDFSNFAFEVQMTIVKGDCGGPEFGYDSTTGNEYIFEVCQDRSYELVRFKNNQFDKTLTSNSSSTIHTGLNASNVIAVVANGSTLDLYVNKQKIDSVTDSTYSHGTIGLTADAVNNPTEVVYSNAKVWTF